MTTIAPEIDTIVDDTTMMVPEMVDTKETTEKEEIVPPTTVQPSVKETTSEPSMVSDGSDTITTIQPLVDTKEAEKEEFVPPTTVQPSVKETTSEPSMVSDGSDTITTIQPLVEDKPIDTTIAPIPEIELEDKLFGETDLETNLFETSTLSSTSTTSSSTVSFTNSPFLTRFPITRFPQTLHIISKGNLRWLSRSIMFTIY